MYSQSLQTYRPVYWSYDEGLPTQANITNIIQSKAGYLYLSTDAGIVRFDGLNFRLYSASNSKLPSNQLNVLFEDAKQRIWFGFEGAGFGTVLEDSTLFFPNPAYVEQFTEFPRGVLWIGTDGMGLWKINLRDKNAIPVRVFNYYSGLFIHDLYKGDNNKLYIASDNGLYVLSMGVEAIPQPVVNGTAVYNVIATLDGTVWYNTNEGLFVVNNSVRNKVAFTDSADSKFIVDLAFLAGHKLLALTDYGLYSLQNHQLTPVFETDDHILLSIGTDHEGSIWLGTETDGLIQLIPSKIININENDGLPDATSTTITQSPNGTVYVGTTAGLAVRQPGNSAFNIRFKGDIVTSVLAGGEDTVWVAFRKGGICLLTEKGVQTFKGEVFSTIWVFYEDKNGLIWAGGRKGLAFYTAEKGWEITETMNNRLTNLDVRVIQQTSSGALWVGTSYGLNVFYEDSTVTYTGKDGLRSSIILDIEETGPGTVWIGTLGGGLYRFKNGMIEPVPVSLTGNSVSRIIKRKDMLWLAGVGITGINLKALNNWLDSGGPLPETIHFDRSNGLQGEIFGTLQPSGRLMQNGELWFPTAAGVAVVPADIEQMSEQPPPITINYITAGRDTFDISGSIKLPHSRNRIDINYTAFSFTNAENIFYSYRLQGFDDEWNKAGSRRTAIYTNLPPGDYLFTIKARIGDGPYSIKPASVPLTIIPALYQTLWFRISAILLIVLILWGVYQYRLSNIRRLEKLRVDIASDLHDEIGSNLGSIALRSSVMGKKANLSESQKENLSEIEQLSRSTAVSMRDIIWLINPGKDHTNDLQDKLRQIASQLIIDIPYNFQISGSGNPEIPLVIRRNLLLIYKEMLHNVIKHARATEIDIISKIEESRISLTVKDNGIGFDIGSIESDGIGLQSMRRRAESVKGALNINSTPGQGTAITLALPIT